MNYLQWALNLSSPEILMWVSTQGSVFKQSIYELNEEIFDRRSWGQSISSICDHFIAFRYSPGRRGDDTSYGEIGQNFEFSCWNIWQPTSRWQFGIQLVHQITACEAPVTLHMRLIHLALWNYIFTISGLAAILSHSHTVYCNIFWWICIAYSLPTGYIHIYLLTRTVLMTVRIFNCPPQSLIRTRVVWRRARRSAVIITGFSWLTVWQTDSNQPCQSGGSPISFNAFNEQCQPAEFTQPDTILNEKKMSFEIYISYEYFGDWTKQCSCNHSSWKVAH